MSSKSRGIVEGLAAKRGFTDKGALIITVKKRKSVHTKEYRFKTDVLSPHVALISMAGK